MHRIAAALALPKTDIHAGCLSSSEISAQHVVVRAENGQLLFSERRIHPTLPRREHHREGRKLLADRDGFRPLCDSTRPGPGNKQDKQRDSSNKHFSAFRRLAPRSPRAARRVDLESPATESGAAEASLRTPR